MTTSPDDRPSMFDFAGGSPAFQALARAHHERCIADPVLEHPFSHGTHPQHVGLPDDSVFRQSMRAYIEWAVHDVMSYAPRDSVVPDDLSMPHWSWDGRQT